MSPVASPARGEGPSPQAPLRRAEARAADAVGALMELWGMKRQMGRVWTVLYLSERPLTAPEACERLGISAGMLSMTLADLRAWGAVRTLVAAGERRERYVAEPRVWRLVREVLGRRERRALEEALRAFEAALDDAREALDDADPALRAEARHRVARLSRLATLTRGAMSLLGAILGRDRP